MKQLAPESGFVVHGGPALLLLFTADEENKARAYGLLLTERIHAAAR